jgi:hypothetical protein
MKIRVLHSVSLVISWEYNAKIQQQTLGGELVSTLLLTKNKIWSHENKTRDVFIKRQYIVLRNVLVVSST